ncbi:SOS-response transcriptional repressor LexA [Volucribacter psittacicida]|uniref:SOS-response transcriptional repressor LexA n=1 Tax=Volucribacter psittacicida TaxID=203482 RepID=A0A4R1FMF6_9PAST|nr:S24 family peptidase [Volucribacter psittacicida]TCJ96176.1 SOS-response transcriptional repressor LexA [Volucribacter psittacicida]
MITEEKIRENFAKRLDLACKEKGLPEKGRGTEIAKILKVTPKAVSKWFNAETMPSASNTYVLAKFLGVTPEWLTYGDNNIEFVQIEKSYKYPLLSTVQAGMWCDVNYLNNIDIDEQFELISSQIKASEHAFFLEIKGESMLPRFNEGDLVLIDPDISAKPGKFVAAINGDGEATFKQYKQLGSYDEYGRPHFNLVPLNDSFPTLSSLEHDITIIGVAVEHRQIL